MRLPALDGQIQPTASTSGRSHELKTPLASSICGRDGGAALRRALFAPTLSPVLALSSKNVRKLCILSASSIETQSTQLESSQVLPLPRAILVSGHSSSQHWHSGLPELAQSTDAGSQKRIKGSPRILDAASEEDQKRG